MACFAGADHGVRRSASHAVFDPGGRPCSGQRGNRCHVGGRHRLTTQEELDPVVDLVGRDDLITGIALNSAMFNLARVIGPAVAGLMIGIVGMAGCFLLNGLSYIAVIIGYAMLKLPKFEKQSNRPPFLAAIREAYSYIAANGPLRGIMILVSTFSVFGVSVMVLMPVFAKDILHGDAKAFGIMMAFNGGGALIGGIALASVGKRYSRRALIYFGLTGCCSLLILFALSKLFWLSCGLQWVQPGGRFASDGYRATPSDEDREAWSSWLAAKSDKSPRPIG